MDLATGDVAVDPEPDATSKRWGVSAILRLPTDFGQSLIALLTTLQNWTGKGHTVYDPTTFHVTLRSIEFFRADIDQADTRVKDYTKLLEKIAVSFTALTIRFEGLSANRVGIILQGYPATNQLQLFRQQFHQQLGHYHLLQGPEQRQPRINAHASLVVFGDSLKDGQGLTDYIAEHRDTPFGQVTVKYVDIVSYERKAQSVKINTLNRVPIGIR